VGWVQGFVREARTDFRFSLARLTLMICDEVYEGDLWEERAYAMYVMSEETAEVYGGLLHLRDGNARFVVAETLEKIRTFVLSNSES